jgi:DNA-binding beta-propeller fold protein YncE
LQNHPISPFLQSPDGNRVYGLSERGQSIFVIKVATEDSGCSENQLIATISIPTTPYAMAITSDGSRIVVTHKWVEGRTMKKTKTVWIEESELGEPTLVNLVEM